MKLKVGDVVTLKGWGCTSVEICRINHIRKLIWVKLLNVRNGMSNRASRHTFDEVIE